METKKEKILKSLEPMFKEAEEKGLWFNSKYQDLWYSPSELKEKQSEGRFIWGKENWELRNPKELIKEHERAIEYRNKEISNICDRISKERESK
jgi:hypothetical protein